MPLNHRDLWDATRVKSELGIRVMSNGKTFLYFFAVMGFDWFQFTSLRLSPASEPISDWQRADAWLTFMFTIFGMLFLFRRAILRRY